MTAGELLRGFPIPEGHDPPVTRWRLTIEFDGGPFMGWQRQEHGPRSSKRSRKRSSG